MTFPNPDWIDDVKICPDCREPHPADLATCEVCADDGKTVTLIAHPRWRPVEGRPGVWRRDDNDPCCVAELHVYECGECGERTMGQHRIESCEHGDAFTAEHHGFRHCRKLMVRLEVGPNGELPPSKAELAAAEQARLQTEEAAAVIPTEGVIE